ncbi:MAG: glycosyltransferase family 2 protein [Tepidisphaeraceae bacterium]|jgi:glycosyltransferase involved in cell wall biosynthesis
MTQVWCGIPVYNNAGTIADVVRRCREQINDVVVVDDGSSDADLRQLLKPLGVTVIRHAANLGKGVALMTAFEYAAQHGGQYMVTLDGDGQHFPEDIPRFLPRLSPDALIIGARREVVGTMPGSSLFGREFSDFWVCIESGRVVADTQSGFRAYPLAHILELRLNSRHYNLEVEVVTRAVWAGLKTENVPIRVRYMEPAQRVSSFRPFRDNLRISLMHARLVLRQLAPIPHRRLERRSMDHREDAKNAKNAKNTDITIPLRALRALRAFAVNLLKRVWEENSSPLGLAAAVALSALLGILLWPWGVIAVAYPAIRLHLNKIVALAVLALCVPKALPIFCARVGQSIVHVGASPGWTRFVGAHVVAFVASPAAALLVYAVARRFQERGQ